MHDIDILNIFGERGHMDLTYILDSEIDGSFKGFPISQSPLRLSEIGLKTWNILSHDFSYPVAILKDSAIRNNSRAMREFLSATDTLLCPHGKTTMCPQLFERQIRDGAWGLTAATVAHVNTYRRAGVKRIMFANQVVDRQSVKYLVSELNNDVEFQFYSLVDSLEQCHHLASFLREEKIERPFKVLIEVGAPGARCGVRDMRQGIALAEYIVTQPALFELVGVEAFEGAFAGNADTVTADIDLQLRVVVQLAAHCDSNDYFRRDDFLLSAGGSIYFDRVVETFRETVFSRRPRILLRSGCYLTHDHGYYAGSTARERRFSSSNYPEFVPALEIWTSVQSIPEPGLAILALGKRDISHDIHLPTPIYRSLHGQIEAIASSVYAISRLSDHHAFMRCPVGHEPAVGELIGLGISHPCTTFDKWRLLYIVDDGYAVIEAIRTYF